MSEPNSLRDPRVRSTLDRLHEEAKGDVLRFVRFVPTALGDLVSGRGFGTSFTPAEMSDVYMPVSREQGEFLYVTARALGARHVVEFGTSFGISTLYLAAAVRDNGGGLVVGSEIEPRKHARATANVKEAGLDEVVDIRLGDALETLRDVPSPLDLVLLDGWKDLYVPVLELLKPRLRKGAVVLADNIRTFRKALRPYVRGMQSGDWGFASTTLSIADGFEYSCYLG